ncbi:sulfotransferase [Candidatus Pelagibacter sp.]|nr:sulfotransferase [Candidatus Pelagibacter sp.]
MDLKTEFRKILQHYRQKNFHLTIEKSDKFLKKFGDYAEIYNLKGLCYEAQNQKEKAVTNYQKVLSIDPQSLPSLVNLGNVNKDLKNFDIAERYYLQVIKINPNYIKAYSNYANLLSKTNRTDESIKNYKKSLELFYKTNENPKNALLIHYNLGLVYETVGDVSAVRSQVEIMLKIDPKFTRADYLLSTSKKYSKGDKHIEEMEHKLNNYNLTKFSKTLLYFSLGKAYEDIKDYQKSYEKLKLANDSYREIIELNFNFESEKDFFNNIKEEFKNFDKSFESNYKEKKMIFIMGMPRSGTTLMEQIISTNDKVSAGGEMESLPNLIGHYFVKDRAKGKLKNIEEALKKNDPTEISKEFYKYLEKYNLNKNIITDKSVLNFLFIGHIKCLFPNAKIIHCKRDPGNNCFSIYKLLFEGSMYWSYSQSEVAQYYKLYEDLMIFWKSKYPDFICDAEYEKIIEHPEKEIKRIIEFCDLEWDDKYLKFYENKNPIRTNSSDQARKPIYKGSLNKVAKYEQYLSEMFSILEK